jgi:hypothetical protein
MGRDADVEGALPPASLDEFTWSHARAVDANPVRIQGVPGAVEAPQDERFLFYRGLGNFEPPVKVTASAGPAGYAGGVTLENRDANSGVGAVFVLDVDGESGAFEVIPEGIAPSGSLTRGAPSAKAKPLEAYADDLAAAMTTELDRTGLYHDEAVAMVNTWRRQWFKTPGVRVLYLAPQAWTDAQIPAQLTPAPDELLRVMVIRVEVITPADEDTDMKYAGGLEESGAAHDTAVQHFLSLGRFAEPRLRRALTNVGQPMPIAEAFLSSIVAPATDLASGE